MSLALSVAGSVCALILVLYARRRRVAYPPGPSGFPLIGNLFDIPTVSPWFAYHNLSRQYHSPIIRLNAAGSTLIIIDTYEVAIELLEKRSKIYSSRPKLPFAGQLMGWESIFPLKPYGERIHRRLFSEMFNPRPVQRFRGIQTTKINTFLKGLLREPHEFANGIRKLATTTLLHIAYGVSDDEYIALAEAAGDSLSQALVPGAFLVDFIPLLRLVPSWMPGAGFQKKAKAWSQLRQESHRRPFQVAKRLMGTLGDKSADSFVAHSLRYIAESDKELNVLSNGRKDQVIQDVAGAMFTGNIHQTFFMCMVLYPDVQRKAQAEIDAVTGGQRLPQFSDMDEGTLPYMTAVVMELLRWGKIAPLGLPHLLEEDDVYEGRHIPKGSLEIYPNANTYNPSRFLDSNGQLDKTIRSPDVVFGFGRRVASTLAAYNIYQLRDEKGEAILVEEKWSESGTTLQPFPFQCDIQVRRGWEDIIDSQAGGNTD
ncbi:cytochrome P450 [Flagelloscypha sp. PMI_526]|nr:cytochrome P450 [Flagelloscypha sp. PMI_526]